MLTAQEVTSILDKFGFDESLNKMKPNANKFSTFRDARDCFVFSYNFMEQKRFERYMEKVKEELNNILQTDFSFGSTMSFISTIRTLFHHHYVYLVSEGLKSGNIEEKEVPEIVADTLNHEEYFYDPECTFMVFIRPKFQQYAFYSMPVLEQALIYVSATNPKKDFIKNNPNFVSFEEMINFAVKYVCQRYLRNEYLKGNFDFDKAISNFLPRTKLEKFNMLEDIFDILSNELEKKFFLNPYADEKNAKRITELYKSSKKEELYAANIENENLTTELFEKDVEIMKLENRIEELQKQVSGMKEKEIIKSLQEENTSVLRSKGKLEKAYNSLVAKYNALKEKFKSSTDAVILERDEPELIDVDTNLNYLFLCDTNRVTTTQSISKIFPNAVFSDKHDCIKGRKADMVIVLTSMIDHSSYGSVKEDAKNTGIPVLHCENTNPEMIRETIWQYLNRN